MSEGARVKRRNSNIPDRRPLRFWEPFNIWWRAELERTGKRATSDDIARWYAAQSNYAWGPEKPSLQETRTHAKCLRSVSSVRDYFREYRAKKKHEQSELELDEEEEDDRRSKSNASRRGSRGKAARSTSTAGYSGSSAVMQSYMAYDEHGYWGSGYLEGAASGVTTAAGQAAAAAAAASGDIQGAAAAQAMAEYEQQMAAFDMAYLHPGAIDLAWANYQQAVAGAAVTSQGPLAAAAATTSQHAAQLAADQQQQQQMAGEAGSAARAHSANFWQQHPGGLDPGGSSQQQEHTQQPGLAVLQIPQGGPTAGRASLSSLLSPALQQQLANGNWQALQAEMPSISPRMAQPPQELAGLHGLQQQQQVPAAPGSTMGPPAALTNPHLVQHGVAAEGSRRHLQAGTTTIIKPDPEQAQHHHAVQPQAPLWDLAAHEQYGHMEVHYGGGIGQDYALPGMATAFGSLAARYQQSQHYAVTAPPPAGPHRLDRLERPPAVHPAASAPAPAAKTSRPCVSVSHSAAEAPHAGACAEGGDCNEPPDSTRHGVIPASLMAAVPLPTPMAGCPGHTTVDSILQQLEAGGRTPRGFTAAAAAAGPGVQQLFTQRASLSTMLEGASMLPPGVGATRQLSQSFEHMPLAHQRLSLYAMGSGMLDMLSEGLDLDGFLATADLPSAAVANGNGQDPAAPTATANRQSLRWLRTSCQMQVPEHWQQHLQNLQEDPTASRGAQGNTGIAPAGQGLAAGPPSNQMFMRRTSSTGMDALAEAAAAALAAHPELLRQGCRGPAAPAQAAPDQLGPRDPAAEQAGGEEEARGSAVPAGGQRKRMREAQGAAGSRSRAEMGPPAANFKRACAGLGISLPDQQATNTSKGQGFKFVLDLATPKPDANPAPAPEQQQQPAPQELAPEQEEAECAEGVQGEEAAAGGLAARPDAAQKRPVVLDLRPEEMGATSENCTPAAALQHAPAQPAGAPALEPQQETAGGAAAATAGPQQGKAVRKVDALMLPPLQSPVGAAGGINTRGALQLGPATAASTTGAPPRGPSGELLPAPAMAHIEMAAAMQAAAMRSLLLQGQQLHAGGSGGGPAQMPPSDPAKRLLPAMHEIERMI